MRPAPAWRAWRRAQAKETRGEYDELAEELEALAARLRVVYG